MQAINQIDLLDKAASKLLAYGALFASNYLAPKHIRLIANALESVERGEIKRLIISLPPRHGKSMTCSQFFPAWYLGRNPDKYIITATYGQDLANDFGRKVRDQISDPMFGAIFPGYKIREDSKASFRFESSQGGVYYSVGVGGPITGRGAHLLLIDDPIKNREEADSEIIRNKTNEWYSSTAYTRLMPNGAIIIIMTRWHEEDLIGYVLKEHAHENWHVITLPAIDKNNQALWPERYPLDVLSNIKRTLKPYDWECLYQQSPIPKEGALFSPNLILPGFAPDDDYAAIFMASDHAISQKESSDESAFSVWGIGYGSDPIILRDRNTIGEVELPRAA